MMVSLLGNKSGKTLESAMNKALLTLAAVVAISTSAQATEKMDMKIHNFYQSGTMHIAEVEITNAKGKKVACMMTDSNGGILETQKSFVYDHWDMKKVLFVRQNMNPDGVSCKLFN